MPSVFAGAVWSLLKRMTPPASVSTRACRFSCMPCEIRLCQLCRAAFRRSGGRRRTAGRRRASSRRTKVGGIRVPRSFSAFSRSRSNRRLSSSACGAHRGTERSLSGHKKRGRARGLSSGRPVVSGRMTIGDSSPFAPCTVMICTRGCSGSRLSSRFTSASPASSHDKNPCREGAWFFSNFSTAFRNSTTGSSASGPRRLPSAARPDLPVGHGLARMEE